MQNTEPFIDHAECGTQRKRGMRNKDEDCGTQKHRKRRKAKLGKTKMGNMEFVMRMRNVEHGCGMRTSAQINSNFEKNFLVRVSREFYTNTLI